MPRQIGFLAAFVRILILKRLDQLQQEHLQLVGRGLSQALNGVQADLWLEVVALGT